MMIMKNECKINVDVNVVSSIYIVRIYYVYYYSKSSFSISFFLLFRREERTQKRTNGRTTITTNNRGKGENYCYQQIDS